VNQQVQHVVALTANLKSHLYPVQGCCLKELGGFERSEQIPVINQKEMESHKLALESTLG